MISSTGAGWKTIILPNSRVKLLIVNTASNVVYPQYAAWEKIIEQYKDNW